MKQWFMYTCGGESMVLSYLSTLTKARVKTKDIKIVHLTVYYYSERIVLLKA